VLIPAQNLESRGLNGRRRPIIPFIGHGKGSVLWRNLKDHLQDKHGYKIECYELVLRAGHGIRDILEDMMENELIGLSCDEQGKTSTIEVA